MFKPLRNELTYDEARDRYTNENGLDHRDWISEKVVILFLESDRHKGTSMGHQGDGEAGRGGACEPL